MLRLLALANGCGSVHEAFVPRASVVASSRSCDSRMCDTGCRAAVAIRDRTNAFGIRDHLHYLARALPDD